MKYKFVDIGCSFFDTSIDVHGLDVDGLLVEPLEPAFNLLPSSDTVKKINVGISDKAGIGILNMSDHSAFPTEYLSKDEIKKLEEHVRHPLLYSGGATLSNTHMYVHNLNLSYECKLITFYELCQQYDITEIDYLNIDTEGHEIIILTQVFDLLKQGKLKINHKITFEYNDLCDRTALDEFCKESEQYGFRYEVVHEDWNLDMVLTKTNLIPAKNTFE
jgi:hypothetical protein